MAQPRRKRGANGTSQPLGRNAEKFLPWRVFEILATFIVPIGKMMQKIISLKNPQNFKEFKFRVGGSQAVRKRKGEQPFSLRPPTHSPVTKKKKGLPFAQSFGKRRNNGV